MSRVLLSVVLALAACLPPVAARAQMPARQHVQGEFSYATGPAPAFAVQREIPAEWTPAPAAPSGTWRTWLVDSQVDRSGATTASFRDHAFEALTIELLGQAAKFQIQFAPQFQRLTIHRVQLRRAGQWQDRFDPKQVSLARREGGFERNLSDGSVTALILLSDVRLGDVVRVSYTIAGENPVIADSDEDTFYLGWSDPVLDRHVRVLYPAQAKVDVRPFGTEARVQVRNAEGRKEILAHVHATAAIADEGGYPKWFRRYPQVQIAPSRTWAEVVSWALPLYPEPGPLPAELEARVAEWSAIADPHARVFAALRTVQREVRYFGIEMGESTHRPAPPAEVWKRRYGDCKDKAYLLVTLLRRMGFEAEPALVSNANGRAVAEELPAGANFDHVIVRAHIADASYWIDPTLAEQRGDLRKLDVYDYGVALPIRAGATALVSVQGPAEPDNSVTVVERFTPNAAGDGIELRVETVYTGQRAESMRWRLNSEGLESLARDFANYYRKRYHEVDVAKAAQVEDRADGDRLVLSEHYRLANAWSLRSGQQRELEVYADALAGDTSLPAVPQRDAPLALARPSRLRHRIVVELPRGWTSTGELDGVSVAARTFRYERSAKRSEGKLEVEQQLDILADHVPAADVPDYVQRMREVSDDMGLRLSMRSGAAGADAERQARLQRLLREAMDNKEPAK